MKYSQIQDQIGVFHLSMLHISLSLSLLVQVEFLISIGRIMLKLSLIIAQISPLHSALHSTPTLAVYSEHTNSTLK